MQDAASESGTETAKWKTRFKVTGAISRKTDGIGRGWAEQNDRLQMTNDRWWSFSPSACRGAAFECCRTHRTIAQKVFALPNVVQQAAPGNVSACGLSERCSIVWIKQRHYSSWRRQDTFAGAACQYTLSLANPVSHQHLFDSVQSKAAPLQALGRAHPQFVICHLSFVILISHCLP